jgi:hypothetical protein
VGSILVVAGGIVTGYFVFKPSQADAFTGNIAPGQLTASHPLHF